jgi:hypothetical protein
MESWQIQSRMRFGQGEILALAQIAVEHRIDLIPTYVGARSLIFRDQFSLVKLKGLSELHDLARYTAVNLRATISDNLSDFCEVAAVSLVHSGARLFTPERLNFFLAHPCNIDNFFDFLTAINLSPHFEATSLTFYTEHWIIDDNNIKTWKVTRVVLDLSELTFISTEIASWPNSVAEMRIRGGVKRPD